MATLLGEWKRTLSQLQGIPDGSTIHMADSKKK